MAGMSEMLRSFLGMLAFGGNAQARLEGEKILKQWEDAILRDAPALAELMESKGWGIVGVRLQETRRTTTEQMIGSRPMADPEHPIDIGQRNAEREWLAGFMAGLAYVLDVPEQIVTQAREIREARAKDHGEEME